MALRDQIRPPEKPKRSRKAKDTPGIGHNAGLSVEHVKSFFERWSRLEDEKQANSDDLKDLFAEAKGVRLNPKAMRVAFRQRRRQDLGKVPSAAEQEEVDLYLAALDAFGKFVELPSHAREGITQNASNSAESDAKQAQEEITPEYVDPRTGEITEVSGASSIPAAEPRPAEPAADKGSAPNSETGNSEAAGTAAETVSAATDIVAGPVAGSAPATHSSADMEIPGFLRRARA